MISSEDKLTSKNVRSLLREKSILILGDSVARGLYKDMIKYSRSDEILPEDQLRNRGEKQFYNDRLIRKGLTNGFDEEVREYNSNGHFRIRFYSLTRSYSTYLNDIVFADLANQVIKPDIIIMNSSLWDLSQYGIGSMKLYGENIDGILGSFDRLFPNAIVLFLSALPVSNSSKGSAVSNLDYLRPVLRGLIRDANSHCSQISHRHNVLYIDLHIIFSSMLYLLRSDGIHWSAIGIRRMNEIIINHLKAFYHGVQDFKLRNKIEKFKQRRKELENVSFNSTSSNEDSGIIDMELSPDENCSVSSKRKRNDYDDDKENNPKVMIKSSPETCEQRIILRKPLSNYTNGKEIKPMKDFFDHQYCDMFYDNDYEGIQLSCFTGYHLESPVKDPRSKPLPVLGKSDCIVLSSDDEEEEPNRSSSSDIVLPIYLLIRS